MAAKLLILDDDAALVDALGQMLADVGYEVVTKLDRTIESVHETSPDLVLIDAPPGHEGEVLNFVQRMRLDREMASIPVIISTTNLKFVEPAVLRERRIHVMVKPFDADALIGSVRKLLQAGVP